MPEWAFLTNHALVLTLIAKDPRVTAREVSATLGITERAVRKIIADLELGGYIRKKREGRRVRYRINAKLPLRHETQQHAGIGDFLELLGWKRRRKKTQTTKDSG